MSNMLIAQIPISPRLHGTERSRALYMEASDVCTSERLLDAIVSGT